MFERFTVSARRVVVLSQGEAHALKQDHIGPLHLLLGVLTAENATAATVLDSLGVEPESVRRQLVAQYGGGDDEPSGQIPFSQDGKKVLEHSFRESFDMGHNYIGTEHLVLGLMSSGDVSEALTALGVRADAVREAVMVRLGSDGGGESAEP